MANMLNKQTSVMTHEDVKGIVAAFRKQKPHVEIVGSVSDCNVVVKRTDNGLEVFRAIKLSRNVPRWSAAYDSRVVEAN